MSALLQWFVTDDGQRHGLDLALMCAFHTSQKNVNATFKTDSLWYRVLLSATITIINNHIIQFHGMY